MKKNSTDNLNSFRYMGYFLLAVILLPLLSMLVFISFNTNWMTNNPKSYLLGYILFASFCLIRLFILRGSYKYANDLILAISAGWIGTSYLVTGQKIFDELPSLELLKDDPLLFYAISFKFILVCSSLISKIVITLIEFIRAWRKEEEGFNGITAWDRIKLIFKKPSPKKQAKR
ncbi:hypothetical protein [Lelliottia amnigena]